jgi:AcrR family transcriptional regulator
MPGRGQYDRTQSSAERRRDQRAALFASAVKVFARVGFAHASVEAIVHDAGMSRRTFYLHFRDLRDVMRKLHARSARFAIALVRDAMAAAPSPLASVDAGITAFLELSAANGDLARVLFWEIRASGDDARRQALEDEFAAMMLAALREAHHRGDITLAPEPNAVLGLIGAVETVAMRLVEQGDEAALRRAAPMLLRMTVNAFRET